MKTNLLFMALVAMLSFVSCKKDGASPQITFKNNSAEGTANNNGEYTLEGHLSSQVRLDKVILTKEGQSAPFLTDATTAKNKNEYDFSYQVTGINNNTTVIIDAYNQEGKKTSARFLIRK